MMARKIFNEADVATNQRRNTKSMLAEKMLPLETQHEELTSGSPRKPRMYDREDRGSFASFREDSNVLQGFVSSKLSSYARHEDEQAVASDEWDNLREPNYHCEGMLPSLDHVCERDLDIVVDKELDRSSFEMLPIEILTQIIDQLLIDVPPENPQPRNTDLVALLLTSSTLHVATVNTLYKNITIPHSRVFRKFLDQIERRPQLGELVRRLDFSHFKRSYGQSAHERAQVMNLTHDTLLQCLHHLPNLQEFLMREEIEEDMSAGVLCKLINMPRMNALDFCGARSSGFVSMLNDTLNGFGLSRIPQILNITRLSFHECVTTPATVFTTLLPRLPHLTHLDLANTRVQIQALNSLPATARLTHLNLSRCYQISGDDLVKFLVHHPSTQALIYLNLHSDTRIHCVLDVQHVASLLPNLPPTLKSLNMKGSKMMITHTPLLKPLIYQLEELSVGSLPYLEVAKLLLPPCKEMMPHPSSATGVEFANLLNEQTTFQPHALKYLDISDIPLSQMHWEQLIHSKLSLLRTPTRLDVLELHSTVLECFSTRTTDLSQWGWICKNEGRRGWLVRNPAAKPVMKVYHGDRLEKWSWKTPDGVREGEVADGGARTWKMGAKWWGMRKVGVANMEVGGVYGWFMFNRA